MRTSPPGIKSTKRGTEDPGVIATRLYKLLQLCHYCLWFSRQIGRPNIGIRKLAAQGIGFPAFPIAIKTVEVDTSHLVKFNWSGKIRDKKVGALECLRQPLGTFNEFHPF